MTRLTNIKINDDKFEIRDFDFDNDVFDFNADNLPSPVFARLLDIHHENRTAVVEIAGIKQAVKMTKLLPFDRYHDGVSYHIRLKPVTLADQIFLCDDTPKELKA